MSVDTHSDTVDLDAAALREIRAFREGIPTQGAGLRSVGPAPSQVSAHELPAAEAPDRATWSGRYVRLLIVSDTVSILVATAAASLVGAGRIAWPAMGLGAVWLLTLAVAQTRESTRIGHGADEYKRILHSSLTLFGAVALAVAAFSRPLSAELVLLQLPVGVALTVVGRFWCRRWLHRERRAGRAVARTLVVGDLRTVRPLLAELDRNPLSGLHVVGVCLDEPGRTSGLRRDVPVLGDLSEVATVAALHDVEVVAVTATASYGQEQVRQLGWELEGSDIDLVLAPALANIAGPRVRTVPVGGVPLLHVERPTYRGANRMLKRAFDIAGSGLLLLAASPVLLTLAALVKLDDRGPVFFRQERVGLEGRSFRMIKFRSMVVDAEAKLAALAEQQRDAGNDVMFKMRQDPRVTRIGRILRRFSLDELPQLLNVFRGEMSLVGPRPPLQSEVELYGADARLRMLVKPGMTGLWQVSGRSDLNWEDSVRLDTYYVENWSITGDLVILFRTAKAVVSSSGAF